MNLSGIETIESEIKQLREQILYHNKQYYQDDKPSITDRQYDLLKIRLNELESLYPIFDTKESPTYTVGHEPSSKFKKIKLEVPMLSLNNAYNKEDILNYIRGLYKSLGVNKIELLIEPKIDGLSLNALYKKGRLIHICTRGNGQYGEDVTHNVNNIIGLSHQLLGDNIPDLVEVRGEVYITIEDYMALSKQNPNLSNPRNTAAGLLRSHKSDLKILRFLAYTHGQVSEGLGSTLTDIRDRYLEWGFKINEPSFSCSIRGEAVSELLELFHSIEIDRQSKEDGLFDYIIDGLVCKVNTVSLQEKLGTTNRSPRWAIAWKFTSEKRKTRILSVDYQIGRTGIITPVANLQPIVFDGVVVDRVTLHNFSEINKKDIKIGDFVIVERAGDVIPKLLSVVQENNNTDVEQIIEPTTCPSCHSRLSYYLTGLYCTNTDNCEEQLIQRLIHFVSKDALDIVGLADKTIRLFYSKGIIKTYNDIFNLRNRYNNDRELLDSIEGFSKVSITNLLNSIDSARNTTLHRFLYSLGIPNIGRTITKDLMKEYKEYDNFLLCMDKIRQGDQTEIKRLRGLRGVGDLIFNSIINYFTNESNKIMTKTLQHQLKLQANGNNTLLVDNVFRGKIVVFTGTLTSITRELASKKIIELGGEISNSITHNTHYLIAGEKSGSKLAKAIKLNIPIMYENQFIYLLKSYGM